MRYGNCLLGVIILAMRDKFRGRIVAVKQKYRLMPHFMYITSDGTRQHYKLVRDIAPWPFCYLIFQGEFITRKRS